MNRLVLLISILTVFFLPLQQSSARESWQVGHWKGASYPEKGAFKHCAMYASYKSGITLFWFLDKEAVFGFGLFKDSWDLNPGETYKVQYWIDGGARQIVDAKASFERGVRIIIDPEPSLRAAINRFRRGYVLHVRTQKTKFAFNLKGTSAALQRLIRCVLNETQTASGNRSGGNWSAENPNPFDDKNRKQDRQSGLRVQALTIAANLLAKSKIANYEMLSEESAPVGWKEIFHAYWRAPGLIGGLAILPRASESLPELSTQIIAAIAEACKGEFESGTRRSTPSGTIRFFTSCEDEENQEWITLFFLHRGDSATYLVANRGSADLGRSDSVQSLRTVDARFFETFPSLVGALSEQE